MDLFSATYVSLWILVLLQGVVIVFLLRQVGTIYLGSRDAIERDGLEIGQRLPPITGWDEDGRAIQFSPKPDQWTVLISSVPTCQVCREFLPEITELIDELRANVRFVLLLQGAPELLRPYLADVGRATDPIATPPSVAKNMRVRVSPYVHVVDSEGTVRAKGLVNSVDHVQHLLVSGGFVHSALDRHVELAHGVIA